MATKLQAAPGTEFLYDQGDDRLQGFQHVQDGDDHILLVPPPSLTDPNDPLRWPVWKKWGVFLNVLGYSFLGGVTGPVMSSFLIPLSERFNQTLSKIAWAAGTTLVLQGVCNVLWMPFAIKYGRRPVYILSNTLMGVACIWLGLASHISYGQLVGARLFLGFVEAPIESIVPSTITDLFFLHNRGAMVSIYGLAVLGGNELGPMFSAIIYQALGSEWTYYIVGIFIFANSVSMFFVMPETKYQGQRPVIRLASAETVDHPVKKDTVKVEEAADTPGDSPSAPYPGQVVNQLPRKSFARGLALFEAPDPNVTLVKELFRPFVLLSYPTVVWACFIYGASLGWNVILATTVAQLFVPQYGFDSQAQGLVFLSPFVGSLVGTWLCGPLADAVANHYTKKNGGIREPEMRLPTCAVAAVLTFIGALVTTLTYNYKVHWIAPVIAYGVLSIGAQMGAVLSMSYALDCHTELSVEVMVTVASLKSLIAWIWVWVINDWVDHDGMLRVFMTIATINVVLYLTTIPLYYHGKRIRIWIAAYNALGRAGLR